LALQNLLWGAFQPVTGALADRYGAGKVLAGGGLLYVLGLLLISGTADPWQFHLGAGALIGMAQAGAGLAIVLGAVGQYVPEDKRSMAFGIVTASASAGQLVVVPAGQAFLTFYGWPTAFLLLACIAVAMIPLAGALRTRSNGDGAADVSTTIAPQEQTLVAALKEAGGHRGFVLLTLGFFVCGFHVAFIGVHLPAYLVDQGIAPEYGAISLMMIGGFNIIGAFGSGILGGKFSKKYLLAALYTTRSITILAFILLPISVPSVLLFSAAMGLLWLSTVPLTSGLVAQIFGPRYVSTLFGIVFFNHQIGSFLGVWLGGYLYDTTGSYDGVWWAGVVLGVTAAVIHWPINEKTVERVAVAR
jgi:MFS family permease